MDGYSPKTMRKSRGFNAPNRRIMLSRLYRTFLALISRPRRGRWCPNRTGRIDPHSLPCCFAARAPACSQYWARAVQSYDRTRMRIQQTARESIQHYQGDLHSGCDIIWLFQMLTCWATLLSSAASTRHSSKCTQHFGYVSWNGHVVTVAGMAWSKGTRQKFQLQLHMGMCVFWQQKQR